MSLRVSMTAIPRNDKPLNFLNFATRNYISARILYLEGQAYDAGILAHEAIEKIMKALIFHLDSKRAYDKIHNLNALRNILIRDFGYDDLKKEKQLFKYYEECYSYRYPDDKQPQSFGTGTMKIHLLDAVFHYFHEECMKMIKDEDKKYRSGIFLESLRYFESQDTNDLRNIITANTSFTLDYITIGMKHWHNKGIYVKKDGAYRDAFGNGIVSRS